MVHEATVGHQELTLDGGILWLINPSVGARPIEIVLALLCILPSLLSFTALFNQINGTLLQTP